MDRLLIDWRRAQDGRARVIWTRDGETQRMMLTAEEIKALGIDYTRTQIRIRLPVPPELERLSRRIMRRRKNAE